MRKVGAILTWLLIALLLCGCGGEIPAETTLPTVAQTLPPETEATIPETIEAQQEAVAMAAEPPPAAVSVVLEPEASGDAREGNENAEVDYSHMAQGYVMARFIGETESRLKVLVQGPTTTYSYNLPKQEWAAFPLSDGNGAYTVGVYENVTGTKYAKVLTVPLTVELQDEFAPFLRPNQYVNFHRDTKAVELGLELTAGLEEPLEKVEAVYDYVVANFTYDYDKAATVKSGYLPDLDRVLEEKKGICFDYAAVMTAMLRSQEIPCRLVVGYAGSTYHAWISVWTEESGWVDGIIFFDGHQWKRMDPTFASSSEGDQEILDFIQNGTYTVKYLY